MKCPHCSSQKINKNGKTHYGKQNYQCKGCRRQFVEGGQNWFVSDTEKSQINKLLLERISLAGISRVVGVSATWLFSYIKELYSNLPDDLNSDVVLKDTDAYLSDRFEEEINRVLSKKKTQIC